jgi:hypothetical protein
MIRYELIKVFYLQILYGSTYNKADLFANSQMLD